MLSCTHVAAQTHARRERARAPPSAGGQSLAPCSLCSRLVRGALRRLRTHGALASPLHFGHHPRCVAVLPCRSDRLDGDYFGELALFTSQRRSASARAVKDCTLYNLTTSDFNAVIEMHPHFYDVIVDKALERLNTTKNENRSMEARINVVSEMQAMLRSKQERARSSCTPLPSRAMGNNARRSSLSKALSIMPLRPKERATGAVERPRAAGFTKDLRRLTGFARAPTGSSGNGNPDDEEGDVAVAPTATRCGVHRPTGAACAATRPRCCPAPRVAPAEEGTTRCGGAASAEPTAWDKLRCVVKSSTTQAPPPKMLAVVKAATSREALCKKARALGLSRPGEGVCTHGPAHVHTLPPHAEASATDAALADAPAGVGASEGPGVVAPVCDGDHAPPPRTPDSPSAQCTSTTHILNAAGQRSNGLGMQQAASIRGMEKDLADLHSDVANLTQLVTRLVGGLAPDLLTPVNAKPRSNDGGSVAPSSPALAPAPPSSGRTVLRPPPVAMDEQGGGSDGCEQGIEVVHVAESA